MVTSLNTDRSRNRRGEPFWLRENAKGAPQQARRDSECGREHVQGYQQPANKRRLRPFPRSSDLAVRAPVPLPERLD